MTTPTIVTYDSLKHDVEVSKLKKAQIQAKYGLPTAAATSRLLREAGLKIRPTRGPVFQLVGKPTDETVVLSDRTLQGDNVTNQSNY